MTEEVRHNRPIMWFAAQLARRVPVQYVYMEKAANGLVRTLRRAISISDLSNPALDYGV